MSDLRRLQPSTAGFAERLSADDLTMWDAEIYVAYLQRYARHFGADRHIGFCTRVRRVAREAEGWRVYFEGPDEAGAARFDHIVVCTGVRQVPDQPVFPEQHRFAGESFTVLSSPHRRTSRASAW